MNQLHLLKPEQAAKLAIERVAAFKASKAKGKVEEKLRPVPAPAPIVEEKTKPAPKSKEELDEMLLQNARAGNKPEVERILKAGANVNAQGRLGYTVLMNACEGGHKEIAELLIAKGANLEYKCRTEMGFGETALNVAAFKGHMKIVELLVARGADVNAKDNGGRTALWWAAFIGDVKVVELLVARGADVNAKDDYGLTALMNASLGGKIEVVQLLITKGADVNAKDERDEYTALKWASKKGHKEIAKLLKENGAKRWLLW